MLQTVAAQVKNGSSLLIPLFLPSPAALSAETAEEIFTVDEPLDEAGLAMGSSLTLTGGEQQPE